MTKSFDDSLYQFVPVCHLFLCTHTSFLRKILFPSTMSSCVTHAIFKESVVLYLLMSFLSSLTVEYE